MRDYKKELKEDLAYGRKNGFKVTLMEANQKKDLVIHISFIFQIIHKIQ